METYFDEGYVRHWFLGCFCIQVNDDATARIMDAENYHAEELTVEKLRDLIDDLGTILELLQAKKEILGQH